MGLRERGLSVPYLLQKEKAAVTGWPTANTRGYPIACMPENSGLSQTCPAQLQTQQTGEKAVPYPQSLNKSPQICQKYVHSFFKMSHRGFYVKSL